MAKKYGTSLAEVKVYINGKDKAVQDLEELRKRAKEYSVQMEDARRRIEEYADGRQMFEEYKRATAELEKLRQNTKATKEEIKAAEAEVAKFKEGPTRFAEYQKATEELKEYQKEYKKLQKSINESEKMTMDVNEAMSKLSEQNVTQLRGLRRQLEATLNRADPKGKNYATFMEQLRQSIVKVTDEINRRKGSLVEFEDVIGNLGKASPKQLGMAKSRLLELISTTNLGTEELKKYKEQLQQIEEEEKTRKAVSADAVMSNLKESSVEQIREAIKATEELRNAQARGSSEWESYNSQIENATAFLQRYKTESKKAAALNVANNLDIASTAEMKQSIEFLTKYRDTLSTTDNEYKEIQAAIDHTTESLQKFNSATRMEAMEKQFANLANLSKSALSEQKKYWQDVLENAKPYSIELDEAKKRLEAISRLEANHKSGEAIKVIGQVQKGTFEGTIKETEEAIKLIQEYKKELKTSDTEGIEKADQAIAELSSKVTKAKEGLMDYNEAMEKVQRIGDLKNPYEGPLEDLEKVKKSLEEYKKQLKFSDVKGFQKVNDALAKIEITAKRTSYQMSDIKDLIDNRLHTAPIDQLKRAAEYLQGEINRVNRSTEEYVELTSQLRNVNTAIKQTTKDWEAQENQIIKTAKRLASYAAVYGGYNFVTGKLREAFQANISLSDSMADVQKTTGMTADEVANLGKQIDALDTRTTQQQLYELAAAAGQLGIRGQENIMGFVKASDMITVALNELGTDGTTTLMKIATLTGDITEYGTEEALTRIGSAINDLTASTAATAGPMVDFISRFGGVASAAGVTTHEMAAVGATVNALGQEVEVAGTSMNQMLTAMMSAVKSQSMEFAQALNVDLKALTDLVNQGKPMEGLVMIFESLQRSENISAGALKALGSEGTRNNRIVTSLVENLDVLKQNLTTSAQAFDENVSILNEYNIKNENAAALLERIKNSIVELFSNPVVTERITSWLQGIKNIVEWLIKSEGAWFVLKTAVVQFLAIKLATNLINIRNAYRDLIVEVKILSKAFGSFRAGMAMLGAELVGLIKGTTTLKNVWVAFGMVLKTHPIMTVLSIVSAVAGAIYAFTRNTKEATEVTEEFSQNEAQLANQFTKTAGEAEKLVEKIKALSVEDKDRARLINEFNSKYSKYLGYMLDEKATADQLTEAYKLLNLELDKDYQLRLLRLEMQREDQNYVNGQVAYIKAIRESMKDMGVDDDVINKTIGYINTLVSKGEDLETVLTKVNEKYNLNLKATQTKGVTTLDGQSYTFEERNDFGNALNDYVVFGQEYNKKREQFEERGKTIKEEAAKDTYESQKKWLDAEYAELKKMTGTEGDELEKRKTAYSNFYNTLNGYINSSTGEQKKALQDFMETFRTETSAIEQLRPLVDMWGKGSNLEKWTTFGDVIKNLNTASPESLASALDEMESATKGISESALANFNEMYKTEFDTSSIDKFNDSVYNAAKKLRARLKELNRGVDGNFLWGGDDDDSNKKAETKARKDMNAALAALEEHFLKRKVIVQQAYLDEKISGEEMNRQIADNDEEFRLARIELRKLLAGDANTFNQSLYPELNGKDLQETSRVLQIIGDAVIDGLRKNVQKDETEIREGAIKIRQAFENELLKNDMFGKFENNFRESLDKLELLSSDFERNLPKGEAVGLSEEAQKKRLTALMELSEKSYQINEQSMADELIKNKEFASWVEKLDADKKTVLLQQLRNYYDQRLVLTKQYQNQLKKEFEAYYEQSGQLNLYERQKQSIEANKAYQSGIEGYGMRPDYDKNRENIAKQAKLDLDKKDAEIEAYEEKWAAANDKLAKAAASGNDEQLRIAQAEMQAAWDAMAQAEVERNELLAQSQRDLTQVYMDEWTKRAERWGQWGEMFGEYLGEQVMLEKQANDARARGDLETAKKIEQQQKQNKQALIQNLLSKIVDEAALWAKEYALKMMFNSLMLTEEKKRAVEEATLQGKSSMLIILLNALTGQSKEHAKGLPGLVTGAIVFAATMALQAFAKSAIANMFPEAATGSTGSRPLSTGMLTYAEGNYPVLGNDGKVYDAKYEGAGMKTGIYGGGAHFGIFSEKQPEMIVDGKTTQKLILNYPYIYDAITTIAKNGRLVNAMPTFATGDYPAGMKPMTPIATVETPTGNNEQIERMSAALEQNSVAFAQLSKLLQGGIVAHLDGLETHKTQKRNERFLKRRGID